MHVLDQLAGGVAGVERVTVVDTSLGMLEAIKVCGCGCECVGGERLGVDVSGCGCGCGCGWGV